MNATFPFATWLVAAALAAAPLRAKEERLAIEQLPPAVQRTLRASHYGASARHAVRRVVDGRAIFEIEIERNNAPNPRLRIAEDGSYVREEPVPLVWSGEVPVALPAEPEFVTLRLEDLPPRVQETVKSAAKGREIADIDREVQDGRTVYEVEFRERGVNSRLHVAEDGMPVREERRDGSLWSRFMGLQIEDVPAPVQETIRRVAGNREIADIDRKGTKDAPVYRVEIKDSDTSQELRIGHDGRLLYDRRGPAQPPRR